MNSVPVVPVGIGKRPPYTYGSSLGKHALNPDAPAFVPGGATKQSSTVGRDFLKIHSMLEPSHLGMGDDECWPILCGADGVRISKKDLPLLVCTDECRQGKTFDGCIPTLLPFGSMGVTRYMNFSFSADDLGYESTVTIPIWKLSTSVAEPEPSSGCVVAACEPRGGHGVKSRAAVM